MKSMITTLMAAFALFFITGYSTETRTLSMYCQDQYWMRLPPESGKEGAWMTGIGSKKTVGLTKDPKYPNSSEPRTFWVGKHSETMNGANVEVDLQAMELNGKFDGFMNTISISLNGIIAESDGGSYLRAAFRSDKSGVGVICREMKVQ